MTEFKNGDIAWIKVRLITVEPDGDDEIAVNLTPDGNSTWGDYMPVSVLKTAVKNKSSITSEIAVGDMILHKGEKYRVMYIINGMALIKPTEGPSIVVDYSSLELAS